MTRVNDLHLFAIRVVIIIRWGEIKCFLLDGGLYYNQVFDGVWNLYMTVLGSINFNQKRQQIPYCFRLTRFVYLYDFRRSTISLI